MAAGKAKRRTPAALPARVHPLPTYGQPKVTGIRERGRRSSPLNADADLATVDVLEEALHDARAGRLRGAVLMLKSADKPRAAIGLAGAFCSDMRFSLLSAETLVRLIDRKLQGGSEGGAA